MIDTHAHLLYFKERAKEIIENMQDDGLEYIVNIGTTLEDSIEGQKLAVENEKIYSAVGIYPENVYDVNNDDLMHLEQLSKQKKVVAIGEIGLDYCDENADRKKQQEIFLKQLEIANNSSLPFCIHVRGDGAVEDLYRLLKNNKNLINHSGLMHCYSCGADWFKKFIDLGLYLSFSGNITFKKNDRSFLKDIPLDRILVETDSPYLSPEPKRGRENQPKNVIFTLECIAKNIGISFEELEKITSENAKRFYNIGK